MVKKILAVGALLLIVSAGAAHAQTYPPGGNTITADDTTVAPGGAIVLGIQICRPSATASFDLESVALGTATADGSGVASLSTTIPSSTSVGAHTITGRCTGADGQPLALVLSITVGAGSGIPVTGSSNSMPMAQIAIGAIAAGGLLLLLGNRRRNATHDTHETAGV